MVILILRKSWTAFSRIMIGYAFASRIPVLVVMLIALIGDWGTHYELGPPGYPEMGFVTNFILIALFPQMTFWIMYTVVLGTLFGGITAALVRTQAPAQVRADAAPAEPEPAAAEPVKGEDTT